MRYALGLAGRAEEQDEVPVGAIIVQDDKVIAPTGTSSCSSARPARMRFRSGRSLSRMIK